MAEYNFSVVQSFSAHKHNDAVQWYQDGKDDYLLLANYQLDETSSVQLDTNCENEVVKGDLASQTRSGGLVLFILNKETDGYVKLNKVNNIASAGVLDVKWSSATDGLPTFGAALADGNLQFGHVEDKVIHFDTAVSICKGISLSLDWSTKVHYSATPRVLVSDSDGYVSMVQLREAGPEKLYSVSAHNFEAWIAAFHYHQSEGHVFFSGGDDCKLKMWDERYSLSNPVLVDSRSHTMGVCSIESNPFHQFLVATGSYDEHVIMRDTRFFSKPVRSTCVGGGVWRLRWDPWNGNSLACACAHGGVCILDCTDPLSVHITSSSGPTKSLSYGIDFCHSKFSLSDIPCALRHQSLETKDLRSEVLLVATCSFYDNLMTLYAVCESS